MSINSTITRSCVDTAVYWSAPVPDGYGGMTFAEPCEILCRWEAMDQIISDDKGNQLSSRAVVYTLQDIDEEGMLYKGTLDDLYVGDSSAGAVAHPSTIQGAYVVKRFQKTPSLGSTTEFLRKAFLTPSLSFGGF
jgi:hypothetical protein